MVAGSRSKTCNFRKAITSGARNYKLINGLRCLARPPSGMIYIPACTLITFVDPEHSLLHPFTAAPRCAIASSDPANYNTCTGKREVQRAGKPQSLNNLVGCVRRKNRLCHHPSTVSPLVVHPAFHPILDRFVICHSAPGILPFARDDPFA